MQKYQDEVKDPAGNGISGASVTVKTYPDDVLATLYDDDGVTAIANPVTTDSVGRYFFRAVNGNYSLTFSATNIVSYTKTDIQLFDPADGTASSDIGYTPAGTGAVATTVQAKNRRVIDIFDKLTDAEKTAVSASTFALDLSSAFANAMTDFGTAPGELKLQPGGYLLGALLTVPGNITISGPGRSAVIKKGYNGDMINLGLRSRLTGFYMDGNGATYTGRGVVITTGSGGSPVSWRKIDNMDIINTESYGVEYTAASAGYASIISDSRIVPLTGAVAAVKYPTAVESNGNRTLSNVWSQSNPLVDYANSDNSTTVGCQGGAPIFAPGTLKSVNVGCRFVHAASTFTVDGSGTVITGCAINGSAITFASTCVRLRFSNNPIIAGSTTITDSSPGVTADNLIDLSYTLYTPTWTGGSPVVGNGSLTGFYDRRGDRFKASGKLVAGTTTTFGAGAFNFSVPYASANDIMGSASIFDSSAGLIYPGTARVLAGSNNVQIIVGTATISSAVPFAFATGDTVTWNIDGWVT